MFKDLTVNRALGTLFSIGLGYLFLFNLASMDTLIVFLNGAFVGTIAAIIVAFAPLMKNALSIGPAYSRVEQMALGIFVLIAAVVVLAFNSVYFRTLGTELPTTPVTALGRYLSICGMIMIITAPDYDQGLFYGRDRRLLWAALATGIVAATIIVLMQTGPIVDVLPT